MKIEFTKSIFILFIIYLPLSGFIYEQYGSITQFISFIFIILFSISLLRLKIIENNSRIVISFILLIIYIIIIHLFYFTYDLLKILSFPLTILNLFFAFILFTELVRKQIVSYKFLLISAVYQLIIILMFIFIDKINGVSYYSFTDHNVLGGIGGNISKYAAILFAITPIFLYNNNKYFYILNLIGIFLTLRRSAIIGSITNLFIFLFLNKKKQIFFTKRNLKFVIIMLIAIIAISYKYTFIIDGIFSSIQERFVDMKDDSAGGRKIFWALTIDLFLSFNLTEMLFGHPGTLAPYLLKHFGMAIGAHSDVLDFLTSYGIVGLFLYLLNHFSFLTFFYKHRKVTPVESSLGISTVISMFIVSVTTAGYFYSLNLMTFIVYGFLVGTIQYKINKVSINE